MPLSPDDLAGVIADAIKAATGPLVARIAVLEAKGFPAAIVGEKGEPGPAGKDAEPVDLDALALKVLSLVPVPKDGADGRDGAPGPAGKDAEVDLDALALKVLSLVPTPKDGADGKPGEPGPPGKDAEVDLDALALKAAELIPVPKDGKDAVAPDIEEVAKVAALLIPTPKDGAPGPAGTSVDPAEVEAMVTKAVAALPIPKDGQDGKSVTVEDVAPLIASEVEKAVKAMPVPKDGVGVAGALIDKDGLLVLTLSDGTMKELGPVVGRDGERGEAGSPGDPGANGIDGKNGTLESIVPVLNERTLSFQYKDGTPVEGWSVTLPMLLDRGVYSSEKAYETGDVTSYGGSAWIAKADSQGKQPGTDAGAAFWRLAVKRGNDGKPGIKGLDGKDGKPGAPGRDGTRTY